MMTLMSDPNDLNHNDDDVSHFARFPRISYSSF